MAHSAASSERLSAIPLVDIRIQASTPAVEGSITFPSSPTADVVNTSQSASTQLTSSDKLTALPTSPSSPGLNRFRNAVSSRLGRRSFDGQGSSSASSRASSPPGSPKHQGMPTSASGTVRNPRSSEESTGKESTSRPRVSFDGDRPSLPSPRPVQTSISARLGISSDPALPQSTSSSPGPVSSRRNSRYHRKSVSRPRSDDDSLAGSLPPSRATSPLRFLPAALLQRIQSREEPFVPIDPFSFAWHFHRHSSEDEHETDSDTFLCLPLPICTTRPAKSEPSAFRHALEITQVYVTDIIPRQIYLHFLLRLPSLYWSRVCHIFEDADVTKPEMQRMIAAACARQPAPNSPAANTRMRAGVGPAGENRGPVAGTTANGNGNTQTQTQTQTQDEPDSHQLSKLLPFPEDWRPPTVSPAMARFKLRWEAFVDAVMREWKTLNILSALLLSAILTMFQIEDAAQDPVTRTAALVSLVCALMSLCYGVLFIVRFGTMRSMYKAFRWADEAQKTRTSILWNCWVLLAMPAVWLAWSMIFFVAAILSYVWRTGAANDPDDRPGLPPREALAARILVSSLFVLGLIYLGLIINTFKSYGKWDAGLGRVKGSSRISNNSQRTEQERRDREEQETRGRGRRTVDRSDVEALRGLGFMDTGDTERRGRQREVREEMDLEKGGMLPATH